MADLFVLRQGAGARGGAGVPPRGGHLWPCIAWLRSSLPRSVESTPILAVTDLDEAAAFWAAVDQDVRRWEGGGFAFVGTDESVVDLGEEPEEAAGGGTCYLQVADVDLWHSGWTAAGFQPSAIEVMPWGMREFRIADPSGQHHPRAANRHPPDARLRPGAWRWR